MGLAFSFDLRIGCRYFLPRSHKNDLSAWPENFDKKMKGSILLKINAFLNWNLSHGLCKHQVQT